MSSIQLSADTLVASPQAGLIEFDGKVFVATPSGILRGLLATEQYYRLDSALAGANVNTAQSLFGVGVTLAANTVYEFELAFLMTKTAGVTSHTVGLSFGGTATLNSILYDLDGNSNSAQSAISASCTNNFVSSASNTTFTPAQPNATAFTWAKVKGTVSVNAGGTFIPQYTLSAAPGGAYSTAAGSFFKIKPIGAAGVNTSIGAWA